jgi:hypothetical protein
MVLATELNSVHVHTTVISPVVSQGDKKLHVGFLSRCDYFVKWRQIDFGFAVFPPLHDIWTGSGTLSAILWEATNYGSAVSIIETPGAHNVQTGLLRGSKTLFNVG